MIASTPSEPQHARLFTVLRGTALAATAAAYILTVLLVPPALAREQNPAIQALLPYMWDGLTTSQLAARWTLLGVTALALIAALLYAWRRLLPDYPRLSLMAVGGIAVISVLDVAANLLVLAETGVPESLWLEAFGLPIAAVAVTGFVAAVGPQRLARQARDAAGLLNRHRGQAASVAVSFLMVASIIAGVAIVGTQPLSFGDHDGTAAAQSSMSTNQTYTGHSNNVLGVRYADTGHLYTASADNTVHKVDVGSMSQSATYTQGATVWSVDVGPNGYVYSGGEDNKVHKLDPSGLSHVGNYSYGNYVFAVTVGGDGYVYAAGTGGQVHKIDPSDMTQVESYSGHSNNVQSLAWGPDDHLYSGDSDGEIHKLDPSNNLAQVTTVTTNGGGASVYALALDNSASLYAGLDSQDVQKLDKTDLSIQANYTGHSGSVRSVAVGENGYLYSGAADNELHRIDPVDMTQSEVYTGHSGTVEALDYGPNDHVYTGARDHEAHQVKSGTAGTVNGDITGRVLDGSGSPVVNATVYATGIETADPPQIAGRDYDELLENPLPADWQDQLNKPGVTENGIDPSTAEFDETRVLMHDAEQWNLEGWPWPQDGVVTVPSSELDPPQTVVAPSDGPTFSCWDFGASTREKFFEDNFGSSLPGAIIDLSCDTIVIERIDPMGDDYIEVSPDPEVRVQQGSASLSNGFTVDYEYAKPELSPGVYKVYAKRQADSPETHMVYTVAPDGDPSNLEFSIENRLADKQDAQTQAQKDLQEAYESGSIELSNTTTNATGHYGLNMPSQVDRVDVVAVKGGPDAQGTAGLTRADVRSEFRSAVVSEFEDTSAISWQDADRDRLRETCRVMDSVADDIGTPYTGMRTGVEPPNSAADIHGTRLIPQAVSEDVRYCYAVNLAEAILNDGLEGLFPGLQDDLGDLSRAELEERYRAIMGYIEGTPVLEDALDARTDGDIDAILNDDPSDLSRGELESRISGGMESIESGGSPTSGGGGGGFAGGGSSSPSVSPPDASTGNETLNAVWQVGNVDDWSDASLLARIHYSNGSTTMLNASSRYVSIDESVVGSDTVRLDEYPLGETDPATVRVELDVATPEGSTGDPDSPGSVVRNPTFDGDIPALRDMRVSNLAPGPSDNVTIDVTPRENARFGSLLYANVSHPACSYSTTAQDEALDVWTCGEGNHHVSVTFSNPGGTEFVETFQLDAKAAAQSRPATVRSKVGPVGRYAMTNGQLRGGDIQTRDGASVVEVIAIAEPGDIPNNVVASTTGMDVAKDSDTVVRVVEGDAQQTVRKRIGVILHRDSPTDDALLYRNGRAVPSEGESTTARINTSGESLTMDSFTDETGEVTLRVNGDPDWLDRIRHWASLNVPLLSVSMSGDTLLLVTPFVVYYRRRKRPPNTGNGGGGEVAA